MNYYYASRGIYVGALIVMSIYLMRRSKSLFLAGFADGLCASWNWIGIPLAVFTVCHAAYLKWF
jgi:hypothetical protein